MCDINGYENKFGFMVNERTSQRISSFDSKQLRKYIKVIWSLRLGYFSTVPKIHTLKVS